MILGMPSALALRSRRYHERRDAGRRVYGVEVDQVEVVQMLVDAGLLHPTDEDDKAAISLALSRLVDLLVRSQAE